MGLAIALHSLAAVIWVGGMFFAYLCMRPAVVSEVPAELRARLWRGTLGRFFPWVWACLVVLLGTGHALIAAYGGMAVVGWHIHVMHGLGLLMMGIFAYLFFSPWQALKRAVAAEDPALGGQQVARIRRLVGTNLVLGLLVVVIGAGGRYW